MQEHLIALMILLVFVFGSRQMMTKAMNKLTSSQKADLVDIFSKSNLFNYAVLILLLGLFFMNMQYQYTSKQTNLILYLSSITVYIIVSSYSAYKKLTAAELPKDYIKAYLISTALRTIGLVIFFALIVNAQ